MFLLFLFVGKLVSDYLGQECQVHTEFMCKFKFPTQQVCYIWLLINLLYVQRTLAKIPFVILQILVLLDSLTPTGGNSNSVDNWRFFLNTVQAVSHTT